MYHPFDQLGLPPNMDKVAPTQRLQRQQDKFAPVTDEEWREILSYYYGLVTQIDWNIGRVLERLGELGLAENTLVIYTSDHGEMAAEMSCFTKGTGSYDATNVVPFIMRLPGVLPAGKVVPEPVGHVDFFPTFIELTGLPVPDEHWSLLEGKGLYDLMVQDQAPDDWPDVAFSEARIEDRHRMVRSVSAKYCFDEQGDVEEFYDLVSDPFEIDNRIDDPDVQVQNTIEDLRTKLLAWWDDEEGHAPKYRETGKPWDRPIPAEDPQPADGAQGVARNVNPEWLPCTAAHVQRVYFGTDPGSLPLLEELDAMESTFNVGTLKQATTYYWTVDGTNENGTTPGTPWSFTTTGGGSGGPGLASAPSPAHRAEGVDLAPVVHWDRGPGSDTQDLYFGPEGELQLLVAGLPDAITSFAPDQLQGGVTYAWRVDAVDDEGTTEGDVWSFTTDPALLPERAITLYPHHLDAQPEALSTVGLLWKHAPSASSYDVYFGTDFPLPFQGNQIGTSFDPGTLAPGETYFWRVDSVNESGTRQGWTSLFQNP
jgi:hypothetical protein